MNFRAMLTRDELKVVFPIIQELRPHLSLEKFLSLVEEASKRDQYEIVAAFENDKCVGAMGYRVLFDLVHGKHLYVDDLGVTESLRSKGIGAKLLKYAESKAQELGCEGLRLCTGEGNNGARKFYEREGWSPRSIAYKKKPVCEFASQSGRDLLDRQDKGHST